jgi:methylmalonyl-CoA/ethylmalonyl-CoA epimerase
MKIKYSHVGTVVEDLDRATEYYRTVLKCKASDIQEVKREGFHTRFRVMFNGDERIYVSQPSEGRLKDILDEVGSGTVITLCYTVKDIEAAYDELVESGAHPVDENGAVLARENLQTASGLKLLWLPKGFNNIFSIEYLEEESFERRIARLRETAT